MGWGLAVTEFGATACGWQSVFVGLPEMLGVSVDMGLMVVFHGRVVVLVRVGGRHGLLLVTYCAPEPASGTWPDTSGDGITGLARGWPSRSCCRDRVYRTGARPWRHGGNLKRSASRADAARDFGHC